MGYKEEHTKLINLVKKHGWEGKDGKPNPEVLKQSKIVDKYIAEDALRQIKNKNKDKGG